MRSKHGVHGRTSGDSFGVRVCKLRSAIDSRRIEDVQYVTAITQQAQAFRISCVTGSATHEATTSNLTHREFLELVLQDEIMTRDDRKINRRILAAGFRDQRRLEDFDFSFNHRSRKYDL